MYHMLAVFYFSYTTFVVACSLPASSFADSTAHIHEALPLPQDGGPGVNARQDGGPGGVNARQDGGPGGVNARQDGGPGGVNARQDGGPGGVNA
ncbi:hypothetical protein F5Y19DRAFT_472742 [Xylariaceae sp. FL1651]|nr:hypothetical protein F5Y19DRAFT_472742 [Xylariaceae sp. FL1651]